jgi:ParB family chromosome partitioning protein
MNPPYETDLVFRFSEKFISEYRDGEVSSAVVLVNNATETRWWQSLLSHCSAVCFPASRVRYWAPGKEKKLSPLQGQTFLYFGEGKGIFLQEFSVFGGVLCQ